MLTQGPCLTSEILLLWIYKRCLFSGSYWEGGILPNIGQFGSTLISLYNPEVLNTVVFGVNMTHAHLRVDEVRYIVVFISFQGIV
jgi:hypothetical protein